MINNKNISVRNTKSRSETRSLNPKKDGKRLDSRQNKGKMRLETQSNPRKKHPTAARAISNGPSNAYNSIPKGGHSNDLYQYPTMISTKCLYFKR